MSQTQVLVNVENLPQNNAQQPVPEPVKQEQAVQNQIQQEQQKKIIEPPFNMRQIQNLSNIDVKCLHGKQAIFLCINKYCKSYGFICGDKNCKCKTNHQDCAHTIMRTIIKQIAKKKYSMQPFYDLINQYFDKAINQLSAFRNKLLGSFIKEYENVGFSDKQRQFAQSMDKKKFQNVTGSLVWSILEDSILDSRIKSMITRIHNDFDNQYTKFLIQIKKYEQAIDNNLIKMKKLNMPYHQLIWDSQIMMNHQEIQTMRGFFQNKIIKVQLLYRASQNQFDVEKFHQLCDYKQNTLTVIETERGKKIGGFTPIIWMSQQKGEYVHDTSLKSFLFSLTNKHVFKYNEQSNAVYRLKDRGPTFGGGHDIYIGQKANQNLNSYCNINSTYSNNNYTNGDNQSFLSFCGNQSSYNFKAKEWQVYQLVFQNA